MVRAIAHIRSDFPTKFGVPRQSGLVTSLQASVATITDSSLTADNPNALGRNGERVAKTPNRVFPPSRGGRTVG